MIYSSLIINEDNCYTTDEDFDNKKYLGAFAINRDLYLIWDVNKYQSISADELYTINFKYIEKKSYLLTMDNYKRMPPNTEIIMDTRDQSISYLSTTLNYPPNLKIFCKIGKNLNLNDIYPIGLEYICLDKRIDPKQISKLKIPFGCKVILFGYSSLS